LYSPLPSFATVLRSFASADGMPFAEVLTEQDIQTACDQEGVSFGQGEDDVYTPAVTLWALLAQCLSACKSCVAAVARVLVLGLPPCGAGSGAYCKARAKLPESLLRLTFAAILLLAYSLTTFRRRAPGRRAGPPATARGVSQTHGLDRRLQKPNASTANALRR